MNLVLAVSGASGSYAADLLISKSPWPVTLVASRWGKNVYERECGPFAQLQEKAAEFHNNDNLSATIASGSVPSVGMVILPCSANTLAKVAAGISDSLITRAAHCHMKEKRHLVLCVRESPWSAIECGNAERVSSSGGTIMPLSPPYYMVADEDPKKVTMHDLMSLYVDRVLGVLGHPPDKNWGSKS